MSNAIIHTHNIRRKAERKTIHEQRISHSQRERDRQTDRQRQRASEETEPAISVVQYLEM